MRAKLVACLTILGLALGGCATERVTEIHLGNFHHIIFTIEPGCDDRPAPRDCA